ncbi:VTT domain-containing protein [Isoptericola sp. NEAU-Y5]|uniref:VTT domain-containing protein n=1 Tax=Isoptericola luteus TaxID=2879484 RepID=A0ABS7ZIP7_9MICO|nr:VTT domain-containing protein [Isoptericola sp. NEAU-Y5]MCA5894899.1 VTT domain-containing protein [Isoptericola sp. NEAU-Y5]
MTLLNPALIDTAGTAHASATPGAGVFTIAGVPFWVVYLAAFGIVMIRAQATYWAGRGVARGLSQGRFAQLLASPRATAAIERVHRWGPPAVTLSFLTVGIQTVINLSAGYLRMPYPRYLVALVLGCLAWAAIWTTVGSAVVNGAILLGLSHPVALVLLGVGVAALVAWIVVRRTRRSLADGEA